MLLVLIIFVFAVRLNKCHYVIEYGKYFSVNCVELPVTRQNAFRCTQQMFKEPNCLITTLLVCLQQNIKLSNTKMNLHLSVEMKRKQKIAIIIFPFGKMCNAIWIIRRLMEFQVDSFIALTSNRL